MFNLKKKIIIIARVMSRRLLCSDVLWELQRHGKCICSCTIHRRSQTLFHCLSQYIEETGTTSSRNGTGTSWVSWTFCTHPAVALLLPVGTAAPHPGQRLLLGATWRCRSPRHAARSHPVQFLSVKKKKRNSD